MTSITSIHLEEGDFEAGQKVRVSGHCSVYGSCIYGILAWKLPRGIGQMQDDPSTLIGQLSPRELEIARAYADGASHKEIGARLFIAPSTVRTHISTIYRKLGVSSMIQLLRLLSKAEPGDEATAPQAEAIERDLAGAAGSGAFDLLPSASEEPLQSGIFGNPAVAVLPFDNLSDDPQQDAFSNGVTEDIITSLGYWRHFPVIARNSTAAAKARGGTVVEIGRKLLARYVVEGSVQRAGERIRLSAHLVDAETGHTIWSKRFDREAGGLFELQDELTAAIVSAVEPKISRAEQSRARQRYDEDLDAWECSQRALWHITRGTNADYAEARRLLDQAAEIAPASGYPRSLLAFCSFYQALFGWTRDPAAAFASVAASAEQAVDLDESDWLAHTLLGISRLWTQRRHDLAKEALDRALDLNPSAPLAHHFNGCTRGFTGEFEEALASQEAVLRLDPEYPFASVVLADMSLEFMLMDDLTRAAKYARRAIDKQPSNTRAIQRLLATLGLAGHVDEAQHWRERLLRMQPDFSMQYIRLTYPFQRQDHFQRFIDALSLGGLGSLLDQEVA